MSIDTEQLYNLLPAIYRIRDAEQGEPLKALLSVIAEQAAVLEEDLAQLYDDQFIETCAEWAIPYIGDLIGVRSLHDITPQGGRESPTLLRRSRAEVANTIGYRRRKGSAAVLEQLARDVTGWDANVVEFFTHLATTQYLNHLRPENLSWLDLRQWEPLERAETPFDSLAHTLDVRRIASRHGRYNIPNVGIFLWRLQSYALTQSPAVAVDAHRYRFSPLGMDTQLFTHPQTEENITHLAEPINVPIPLSRRVLAEYLEEYYGADKSLLLTVDSNPIVPDPNQPSQKLSDLIKVCNLSDAKDANGNVLKDAQGKVIWGNVPDDKIVIDPVLGRLAFPTSQTPSSPPLVTYYYGFSTEMGGGEYNRADSLEADLTPVRKVPADFSTIQESLENFGKGAVEIGDSRRYQEIQAIAIQAAASEHIELRAEDGFRPTLVLDNNLAIAGGEEAEVTLNGLLIIGKPLVLTANSQLRRLRLQHCTLIAGWSISPSGVGEIAPDLPSLFVNSPNTEIEIDRCIILGGLRVVDSDSVKVSIRNSIIDAIAPDKVAYAGIKAGIDDTAWIGGQDPIDDRAAIAGAAAGAALTVENSTIVGKVHTKLLELASNSIFFSRLTQTDLWKSPVWAERRQQGCVRFSYVPLNSLVPRLYRCQPDLALTELATASGKDSWSDLPLAEQQVIQARLLPQFTSLQYGNPAYCQLSQRSAIEIRQGADDEAEMGAFHDLYQPQRETNLRLRLDEYLRFGLEAGIFYAT